MSEEDNTGGPVVNPPPFSGLRARAIRELRVAASTDRGKLGFTIARFIIEGRIVRVVGMGDAVLAVMFHSLLVACGHLAMYKKSLTIEPSKREREDERAPGNMVTEVVLTITEKGAFDEGK